MHGFRATGGAMLLATVLLAGCASGPGKHDLAERDPLEGFNRGVWAFNDALDTVAIKPTTSVYRTVTPRPARRGLSRIFANLGEPFSAINNLLQGKPDRAIRNLGRFTINSTIGVGGLADHATGFGMAPAIEDFGQTLATWGVNGGPYLVLPLLGPSTLRDGVGSGISQVTDPYRIALRRSNLDRSVKTSITGLEIINIRSELIELGLDTYLETSLDPYSAARSAYLQRRAAEIRDEDDALATYGSSTTDMALSDEDMADSEAATHPGEAVDSSEIPPESAENPAPDTKVTLDSAPNNAY